MGQRLRSVAVRYPTVTRSVIDASADTTPHMAVPSSDLQSQRRPPPSAQVTRPSVTFLYTSDISVEFAEISLTYSSGNPPPVYSPFTPCGNDDAVRGSNTTSFAPAASSCSRLSSYAKLNAGPTCDRYWYTRRRRGVCDLRQRCTQLRRLFRDDLEAAEVRMLYHKICEHLHRTLNMFELLNDGNETEVSFPPVQLLTAVGIHRGLSPWSPGVPPSESPHAYRSRRGSG